VKWKWGHPVSEWPISVPRAPSNSPSAKNPKSSNFRPAAGHPAQYPQTRMGVEEVIRQSFTDAKDYIARWTTTRRKRKRGETPIPPRHDILMETMVDIPQGQDRRPLALLPRRRDHDAAQLSPTSRASKSASCNTCSKLQGAKEIAAHGSAAARSSTGGDSKPRRMTPSVTTSR